MTDERAPDAEQFLSRIRNHYVDQLRLFAAEQRSISVQGEAEVKVELERGSKAFRSLVCADFARNDGTPELIPFEPREALGFDPIRALLGNAELEIEQFTWDDVVIHHNASFDAEQTLGSWFERWFDPEDRRYRPGADLGNVIHSLAIEPGKLSIDFGSAAPEAFWELLNCLERAGATEVRVSGSPVEAAAF